MKTKIYLLLFSVLIAYTSQAQHYFYNTKYFDDPVIFEGGLSIGPMNSLTDIGGRQGIGKSGPKDLNIKSTTLSGGFYFGLMYNHFLGVRLEGTTGYVHSNDSLLKGVVGPNKAIGRYNRNLSFRSPIRELSLNAEFHPVDFFRIFDPYAPIGDFSPYVIGGVGFFHFNPQAKLNNQWIDLRPLHTEGEGFAEYPRSIEYSLNQFNFSYGVGLAYELSPRLVLRLEYISRVLHTDYLDDLHGRYIDPALFGKYLSGQDLSNALQLYKRIRPDAKPDETTQNIGSIRGNPSNNDSYFTINFKVGFIINRQLINPLNKKYLRAVRSPTRF